MSEQKIIWPMLGFVSGFISLCVYSFSRVDLNLTLFNFPFYLNFQSLMTEFGYYQRGWASLIYGLLIIVVFVSYLKLVRSCEPKFTKKLLWLLILGILAYPMFSYDIFNYIFNAKMVWVYQANPHVQTASQFSQDLWLRFMHNIHTPAPYAYGWTLISLIPGILTLTNNLKISLWGMKLFIAFFWLGQLWILAKLIKKYFPSGKENWRWFLFVLNPLVLMETLIIGHNDVVMMFWVLVSLWFLLKAKKYASKDFLASLVFLGISTSIKYATIILLPLYFIKLLPDVVSSSLKTKGRFLMKAIKNFDFFFWGAIFLVLVMFTRLDQLHSWYLIWGFSLVVLSKSRWLIALFTALAFGALLRYMPYIFYGTWDPPVYLLRNVIWLGVGLILVLPILGIINNFSEKNS